jgi:hypothetical protein
VESTGLSSNAELEQRAIQISRDQESFDRDDYAQEELANELRHGWKELSKEDQGLLLQRYALLFPRTRENQNPQQCLRRILNLPSGEDVQRALRVRTSDYAGYVCDPGEDIYPSSGWLGRYLEYARWNKVPLALHFWAGASILGAAIRRNYYVDNNVARIWLSQFIVLAGPKGNGKTVAMEVAQDVLTRMNRRFDDMETTGVLSKPNTDAFKIPFIASDITPQDLTKQLSVLSAKPRSVLPPGNMVEQPKDGEAVAIMFSDELSNTAGSAKFGAGLMIPLLTQLGFGAEYHKSTKTGGQEDIWRMAFSILACTQPGWMRNTISSDAKEGGFIERVNFIYRPPSNRKYSFLRIPILDPLQAERLAEELIFLCYSLDRPKVMRITEECDEFFHGWWMREAGKIPRDLTEAEKHTLDRRCIHILRLASILAISEGEDLPYIQTATMKQAIGIVEAELEFIPLFMAQANETDDALKCREVLGWLNSQGGWSTKRTYAQRFRKWELKKRHEIIKDLLDTGSLQVYPNGKGGTWYGIAGLEVPERALV